MKKKDEEIKITYLPFPENVRKRPTMYLASVEDYSVCYRELTDNATDEVGSGYGDTILLSTDFNGFNFVADNGRGLPITLTEVEGEVMTQAALSLSKLHSGSKFESSETAARAGINGVGSSAVQAVSEIYVVLSRITEDNFDRSIPEVRKVWDEAGLRSKKDLYYILVFQKGYKVFEGAGKLKDIEEKLFGKGKYTPIPTGMSTLVFFKADPEIYESVKAEIPKVNLQYFLLIQEKFYGRKVNIYIDGEKLVNSFKPYQFEVVKTIIPKDTSANKRVDMYLTFEIDKDFGNRDMYGSINGLDSKGLHIQIAESCFKTALKDYYKIKHSYLTQGLKFCVVIIANEVMFSSQTKENLKSITKVKTTDFVDVVKEIQKVFKKNPEYWDLYYEKLEKYAESMRDLGAVELAEKMMSGTSGVGLYRNKATLVPGFADATGKDRMACELFLCEGNSAAGSLVAARPDTTRYAVLPLRGKILNVTNATAKRAMESQVIYTIFSVIGLGLDANNVVKDCKTREEALEVIKQRSRYGKIIVSTDADADGSQIANELIYLFGKFASFMIDLGLIYRAVSPLWKGISRSTGKETYYYPDDPYNKDTGFPLDMDEKKHYARYKGLGSLSPETGEVEDVFFNESRRRLIRITSEGLDYARKLNEDINARKELLSREGILTNPYEFKD